MDDFVELRLGLGGRRRTLVVRAFAVRGQPGSARGLVEVQRGLHVLTVPEERVRRMSLTDALEVARGLLGLGASAPGGKRLLERMGFGTVRSPSHDMVAAALLDRYVLVELEDDRGRWNRPNVPRQAPKPTLEFAAEPALTWISFTIVDDDTPARPLSGARFTLRLPDRSSITGALDREGYTRVADIERGSCWLEITELPLPEQTP